MAARGLGPEDVINELQPGGMDLLGRWTVSADRVLVF
jgi:hypothetical protein